jgi:hypothetical protein
MLETAVLTPERIWPEIVKVCCHCRRVRTPSGTWVSPSAVPHGPVSHGICRDCFVIHYPEFPPPEDPH